MCGGMYSISIYIVIIVTENVRSIRWWFGGSANKSGRAGVSKIQASRVHGMKVEQWPRESEDPTLEFAKPGRR